MSWDIGIYWRTSQQEKPPPSPATHRLQPAMRLTSALWVKLKKIRWLEIFFCHWMWYSQVKFLCSRQKNPGVLLKTSRSRSLIWWASAMETAPSLKPSSMFIRWQAPKLVSHSVWTWLGSIVWNLARTVYVKRFSMSRILTFPKCGPVWLVCLSVCLS